MMRTSPLLVQETFTTPLLLPPLPLTITIVLLLLVVNVPSLMLLTSTTTNYPINIMGRRRREQWHQLSRVVMPVSG